MRLALGMVAAPLLRRRRVLASPQNGGAWRPLDDAARAAGLPPPDDAACSEMPAAIAYLSALTSASRRKLKASVAAPSPDGAAPALLRPVDDRAKVMIVGGWNPVSRPDLKLDHVTPHVMARWMDAADFRRPPITVFKKFPSALAHPGAELPLPAVRLVQGAPSSGQFEADAVLAVVIGKPALRVSVRGAMHHVAGLSLMLDVWDHEIFMEESRVRRGMLSKNLRGLSPFGPDIRLLDKDTLHDGLDVTLKVNGALRQRFQVDDFAYSVAEVISFCSSVGLEPGDVLGFGARIARGNGPGPLETPVPVAPGDVIEVAAGGIGTLTARAVKGDGLS
jgi:2-keto-4-pentenoate hydratase/2-oxohepta-3-ene-1,7-dioic acid hydratase in catechol pathway